MLRLLPLVLLSGCWLAIHDSSSPTYYSSYSTSSSGGCVERICSGRSYYYAHAGERLGDRQLERIVERDPDERARAPSAFRLRRAGWALFGTALVLHLAAIATMFGAIATDAKGELPRWAGITVLTSELNVIGMIGGGGVAATMGGEQVGQAVTRVDAHAKATGVCPAD